MNNFMNGFIKALSRPSSADNLYEAGMALDKWLDEGNRRQELMDAAKEDGRSYSDPDRSMMSDYRKRLFEKSRERYWNDTTPGGRFRQSGSNGMEPGGRDAELSPEGEREIDKMMLQLEDQLIDILNRGNPDPRAKQPGAPRRVPFFMRDPRKQGSMPGGNSPSYRDNP